MPAPEPPRAVLLDLDGVLYVGDAPIPGAIDAVARLRDAGLALRFVTNTTTHTRAQTAAKLRGLGVELDDDELVTPAALAVRHCRERGHRRVALVMHEAVKADFAELEQADEHVDAVIVGDLGADFAYEPLNRAFRLLIDGAELVALQKNRYWLTPDGLSLDAGAFVAALEFASGSDAVVVGKPSPGFFQTALATAGATAREAAMVGDDVESDIGGAQRAGLRGVLVRTGKYREEQVAASGVRADAVVDSIADVPELLERWMRAAG
ncbi:MAG TPA: TIGR01458 family HAD-type hydrolase [Solirubrobacteraceae bacterium]|nr:TIGR01458 family HAD-type hydrolase [Solirubrobacteraceae bacterium]